MAKLLKGFVFLLFIASIVQIFIYWQRIPEKVPTHYNISGEADAWGAKGFVFFIPLLAITLWSLLGTINNPKFINIPGFNYKNASQKQLQAAIQIMQVLRYELLALLSLISLKDTYNLIATTPIELGYAEFIIFVGILIGTILFAIIRVAKTK